MALFPLHELKTAAGKRWGRESIAALSDAGAKVESACIFVHGWGGSALATWQGFPALLASEPAAAGSDFLYWDYESRRRQVGSSAALFREFLANVLTAPAADVVNPALAGNGAPARAAGFQYRRIVICAHSLGALVARQAIVDLERSNHPGFRNIEVKLLLFAPAHCGSEVALLLKECGAFGGLPVPAAVIAKLVSFYLPSAADLEPESTFLKKLAEQNAEQRRKVQAARGILSHLVADVWHAELDKTVKQVNFDDDSPFGLVKGLGHSAICKPTAANPIPQQQVVARL